MKKLTALLLIAAMLLSLAACGKDSKPDDTTAAPSTAATNPTKPSTQPSTPSQPVTELDADLVGKKTYSVSAADALANRSQVIATMADQTLTNGQFQLYYWINLYDYLSNNAYYLIYMGLDYTKPLDEQNCPEINGTWQHYFMDAALKTWRRYQALSLVAQKEGVELTEDLASELDKLYETLEARAKEDKYDSVDAMIQNDMGPGCTFEDYLAYMQVYYKGYHYLSYACEQYQKQLTDEQIQAYFTEHEEDLKKQGITKDSGSVYGVRHILIEVAKGKTEDDWKACQDAAQKLMDQWVAGGATEESFAALAKEHSTDGGSNSNGGLYTGLDKNTNFVTPFKDWYLAEGRQVGDYGLVKTDYGYHIMYFSSVEDKWMAACRDNLTTEYGSKVLEDAIEAYPMTVEYDKISLGVVDLTSGF